MNQKSSLIDSNIMELTGKIDGSIKLSSITINDVTSTSLTTEITNFINIKGTQNNIILELISIEKFTASSYTFI